MTAVYLLLLLLVVLSCRILFPKWWSWIWSTGDEIRPLIGEKADSYFMLLLGAVFLLTRRLSVWEHIKHLSKGLDPHEITPARATDLYIMAQWTAIASLVQWHQILSPHAHAIVCAYIIIEIVQSCLYHNLWRIYIFQKDNNMGTGHDSVRTLFLSFGNFIAVCVLFGCIYWDVSPESLKVDSIGDALYFSFVCGATVGFGDISPGREPIARVICVLQILVSMALLTVVVGQAVGAVGSLSFRERNDLTRPKPEQETPQGVA